METPKPKGTNDRYSKKEIAIHTDFAKLIARLNVKQLYMLRNMCAIGIEMRLDDSEDDK